MTRRKLGLLAMASAAAPAAAQAPASNAYSGPLTGLEHAVNPTDFDPVAWTQARYDAAPLQLTFRAKTQREAAEWQGKLRSKLKELLGPIPATAAPLQAKTLETRECPGYRREKVVFQSRPGVGVLAYLLTPKGASGKLPAVVCVPGHGRGVDDIVGIDETGRDRTDKGGYQHDFAIQTVEQGVAAVAIEPMAFGCRRDARTKRRGLSTAACQPAAGAALLLGETMIGWRAYDVMRTIDWIGSRPELDSTRIGCMGISGGGTATLFTAAIEPRIRAAMVSGYLNTFRDSILSISHCIDNYVPGILQWAEMYDIAGLIAPRPLFIESGDRDNIFPIDASRTSFARVQAIYQVFGAAANTGHEVFAGEHSFHGAKGIPFLVKALAAEPGRPRATA